MKGQIIIGPLVAPNEQVLRLITLNRPFIGRGVRICLKDVVILAGTIKAFMEGESTQMAILHVTAVIVDTAQNAKSAVSM